LCGDGQRSGDDGDPLPGSQVFREFERGGARIEHNAFAVLDLLGGDGSDGLFCILIFPNAVEKLEFEADSVGHCSSAVCAEDFSLVGQGLEIAANSHSADVEPFDQVLDRTFAVLGDQLAHLLLPRGLAH
jgi:hypothetical protein